LKIALIQIKRTLMAEILYDPGLNPRDNAPPSRTIFALAAKTNGTIAFSEVQRWTTDLF
jgi:hypothetical protein